MKHEKLISQMTPEEKASLMSGKNFWHTKSVDRLGVPSMMLTDGPHGLRKQAGKSDNLGLNRSVPATCYPTAAALANSWDEEMLELLGERLGLEAASEQVSVLLGPGGEYKAQSALRQEFRVFLRGPFSLRKGGRSADSGYSEKRCLRLRQAFRRQFPGASAHELRQRSRRADPAGDLSARL